MHPVEHYHHTMVSDAERLANWRTIGARHSEQVLDLAPKVLQSGGLGEQGTSFSSIKSKADG
jgi:ribosomal protein S16